MDFVTDDEVEWEEHCKNGWTEERRKRIEGILKPEFEKKEWKDLVLRELKTPDVREFWKVKRASKILRIDLTDVCWDRLKQDTLDCVKWYDLVSCATIQNIDEILEYGLKTIPLELVATGAADELGLGKGYSLHNIVSCIVQKLELFKGRGEMFIKTALKSPVVSNRNTAIRILESWGNEYISEGLKEAVSNAQIVEPREDVKERLKKLMLT